MFIYEKSSIIKCDVQDLFAFHLSPKNLKYITPPDTKVTLENENFEAKEGELLRIKTVKYYLPTRWIVKIAKVQQPNLLVDIALKSPFAYWEHHHIFTNLGDGTCELRDRVKYDIPLGFIGRFFSLFVFKELASMFTFRHKVTKAMLEKK
ncbi:MAG: SRPBCC family protein [Sulfurospirillum sp.]|nr:SRPBCC family protein [Sulfurospirillum sp.]